MKKKAIVTLVLFVILSGLQGCVNVIGQWHYFTDMYYAPSIDAQQIDELSGRNGNILPPEGSVPYGTMPYPHTNLIDSAVAAKTLKMPAGLDYAAIGAQKYAIFCSPCHGIEGKADGFVKKFMPMIVPVAGDGANANGLSAEQIYHIMTVGRGTMLGYGSQIKENDRWAIAQYIKQVLQKPQAK